MVVFTSFSDNNVFSYGALNVFFNQLYTLMVNAYSPELINEHFFLDGNVALAHQGEAVSALDFILISASKVEMYAFLVQNITALDLEDAFETDSYFQVSALGYIIRVQKSEVQPILIVKEIPVRDKNSF